MPDSGAPSPAPAPEAPQHEPSPPVSSEASPSPPADSSQQPPPPSISRQPSAPSSARASPRPDASIKLSVEAASNHASSAPVSPKGTPMMNASQGVAAISSNSSVKDDAATETEPDQTSGYGTRSRRSGATRPNYADNEYDNMEEQLVMDSKADEPASSKRSTPSDSNSKPRPTTESGSGSTGPTKLRLHLNSSATSSTNANGQDKQGTPSNASTAGDVQPRKKRKYDRKVDKNGGGSPSIPGSFTFFASPSGEHATSTAPPAKKRKTGENIQPVAASNSPGVASTRKASVQSPKYGPRESKVITFEKSKSLPTKDGKLEGDDGNVYAPEDHVYLICEPPGDPYYLARIMEFRREKPDDPRSPVTRMLVNWFYRPKDIGKYSIDVRQLYASMQSDECPITSLRGKCRIEHRSEIKEDFEDYRKLPDAFWFNQLYDRYIQRHYEVLPTRSVINVPERVKKALDERWKYLVVEQARLKELTSKVKLCKRCRLYCAPNDSVDCGVCHNTYHMACVRPPLTKKPSRGFAWSCGPCSRRQERRLQQKDGDPDRMDEDIPEEEEEETQNSNGDPFKTRDDHITDTSAFNQLEIAHSELWPWRYLGIHCKVEDVLQYDDRAIYPRASSRLGPRHQANVIIWYGRPVELIPREVKKRNARGQGKKDTKSKESIAAAEAERQERANRPRWVQDAPPGYVARGEDNFDEKDPNSTATRLFVMPPEQEQKSSGGFAAVNKPTDSPEDLVSDYMAEVDRLAESYGQVRTAEVGKPKKTVRQVSTNYLDQALKLFTKHSSNKANALAELREHHSDQEIGNPVFTKQELNKFEDGVLKHGTEFKFIKKMVKSRSVGQLVRFYYTWKSTPRGKDVRLRHGGRRGAKKGRAEASWTEIADEEDDSAFDNAKAEKHKRRFQCKFCLSTHSRQWRRAPNIAPGAVEYIDPKGSVKDKANQLVVSLCNRCAYMWRKYGMRYEDPDELAKSLNSSGGRAQHRKMNEEVFREVILANEAAKVPTPSAATQAALSMGLSVTVQPEPPKVKKYNKLSDKDSTPQPTEAPKKARARSPPPPPPKSPTPPPIIPNDAKMKDYDCAICRTKDDAENGPRVVCQDCRLTVHRLCFAIPSTVPENGWTCDPCTNDKNPQVSIDYTCCICRQKPDQDVELIEQPKPSHKKKSDRDREKERLEGELRTQLRDKWVKSQREAGKSVLPRPALKKTACNNWIHLSCAIFMPELKFASPETMDNIEGMGALIANPGRSERLCKLCLSPAFSYTMTCSTCTTPFHVSCALDAGYKFGFDVSPVKGSRKDIIPSVPFKDEAGVMTASIWCNGHAQTTTIVHALNETTTREDGATALQAFVQEYKTPDLTLTGTARKANLVSQSTKAVSTSTGSSNRRASTMVNGNAKHRTSLTESSLVPNGVKQGHQCDSCGTQTSFKWHRIESEPMVNGHSGHSVSSYKELCHKCLARNMKPEDQIDHMQIDQDVDLVGEIPEINYFEQVAPSKPPQPPEMPPPMYTQQQMMPGIPYAGHSQGAPPAVSVQKSLPDGVEESFLRSLESITITVLAERTGLRRTFTNSEFQLTLEGNPAPAFHYLLRVAFEVCKFDNTRQVIVAQDGSGVTSPHNFVTALNNQIQVGQRDSTWLIKDKREVPPSAIGILPPPATPGQTPSHEHMLPAIGQPLSQGPPGPYASMHGSPAPPPDALGSLRGPASLRDAIPGHQGVPPTQNGSHPMLPGLAAPPPYRGFGGNPPPSARMDASPYPPRVHGPAHAQATPGSAPLPGPGGPPPGHPAHHAHQHQPIHQQNHQSQPGPPLTRHDSMGGGPQNSMLYSPPSLAQVPAGPRPPPPMFPGSIPPAPPRPYGHAPTPPVGLPPAGPRPDSATGQRPSPHFPDATPASSRPPQAQSQPPAPTSNYPTPNGPARSPAAPSPYPSAAAPAASPGVSSSYPPAPNGTGPSPAPPNPYPAISASAASPPPRVTTPRDTKAFGASSSPNLKNLMH